MTDISTTITDFLAGYLQSSQGVNARIAALRKTQHNSPHEIRMFSTRNVAMELMEKANQAAYPGILVYCEKLSNVQREKFRVFSGTARLTVELRNSEDRLEMLDTTMFYSDLICRVLDTTRGEWFPGVSYGGEYEVVYSPVKTGGKHFFQSAKISFEVSVSK